MLKKIAIGVAVVLGLAGLAGVVAGDDAEVTPENKVNLIPTNPNPTPNPHRNPRPDRSFEATCLQTGEELGNLWLEYSASVEMAVALGLESELTFEIKDAGRELIRATRGWLAQCGHLDPVGAADMEATVDMFEDALSSL